MQTLTFQQSSRAPAGRLIFNCHQKAAEQSIEHRAICSAVRAWAAAEGRMVAALQIQEAAEEMQLFGVDLTGQPEVWNVKLFRWLDNKEDSAVYRANIEQLAPAIISVLPLAYRDRIESNDNLAYRLARLEKEVSEGKQALMLNASKKEKLKEMSEGIFEMFRVDPDLTAPLLAMVTTMLGAV